jgi:O-antigen ligase
MNATGGRMEKYGTLLFGGLVLFSLSLALSKSATNILMALIYLSVLFLAARYQSFRSIVMRNARQPLLLPLVLYLSAAVIGLLFTEHLADGLGITNKIVGLLLAYLMVSVLIDSIDNGETAYQNAEKLLLAFLVGAAALNVIAFMTYLGLVGHKKFVLPLAPLNVHHIWFSNLNAIGMYTAVSFLLFSSRKQDLRYKTFFISFLLLSGVSVLMSLSRTAWLGIFFTTVILTYIMVKKKKVFFMALLGMLGTGVLLYFFNQIVHSRLNEIVSDISLFFTGQTQTNIGQRFLMWKAAFRMFLSNPLFGVGTGDYVLTMGKYMASGEFPPYLAEFNQPHNMYLFALATNGLLGLAALLYIFYQGLSFALPLMRSDGKEKLFAFLALATTVHFMIAGLTDSFFNIQILRYTFAFVMGVCVRNSLRDPNAGT